ncbi:MAG: 3-oxoacyl-ACP reductase FabG [Clostridiales bacterium]|nr:3-oxoacyl-ACP reductase FabG [Clostridiales bacterium]
MSLYEGKGAGGSGAQTVLITGASGGIGRALVRAYAAAGYQVAIHYHRDREGAEEALRLASGYGAPACCFQADISDAAQVRVMAAKVEAGLGEVACLVNNAGYSRQSLFTEISDEEWEHMFAVHVHGAFYCCKAVLPAMIRRKSGSIINISSMWGRAGASCEVHYSAAKAALEGMTKALAKELGPSGIRVNCVAPGVIDTAMNRELGVGILRGLAEDTALGRLGAPEDVAGLALYLSGREAAYITGQVVSVDGGYLF